MGVDRARAVIIIREIRDAILAEPAGSSRTSQDSWAQGLLRRTCSAHDVGVEEWIATLQADPELGRLLQEALDEATLEPPDPGPYDEISRESPNGWPGADRDAFDRDALLLAWSLR
jgi:hypothetical protein